MKKFFVILIFISQAVMSQTIPTSARSQAAISKLTPQIELDFSNMGLELGSPIFIRIFKQEAELEIWVESENNFKHYKTYPICTFGYGGLGPKLQEGDGKAPEGFYFVTAKQMNPFSSYHLSFNLGYPNEYDRIHNRTGSALMVHGGCVSVGCYAMTDKKVEEIYTIAYKALQNKQSFFRVHVFPFKMTQENMTINKKSQWHEFWINLKQGYDYFENNHFNPPNVTVKNLKYHFSID